MGKGAIAVGAIIILFGLFILIVGKMAAIIPSLIIIAMGVALIICWREESIIEKRKDIPKSKQKTPKK